MQVHPRGRRVRRVVHQPGEQQGVRAEVPRRRQVHQQGAAEAGLRRPRPVLLAEGVSEEGQGVDGENRSSRRELNFNVQGVFVNSYFCC